MIFPFIINPNLTLNPEVVANGGQKQSAMGQIATGLGARDLLASGAYRDALGVPDDFANQARSLYSDIEESPFSRSSGSSSIFSLLDYLMSNDYGKDDSNNLHYYPSPSAQQLDYFGADIAKHYGMDRTTAYNEAMANTAYQRAVADMQLAGLNPASLFSAGRASSAGSGYASGVAGGYTSASGASQSDGKLPGWIYYGVPALAQVITTFATKNPGNGYVANQVASQFMKAFNGLT